MRARSVYPWLLAAASLAGCNVLTGADGLQTDDTGSKLTDEPADAAPAVRYRHADSSTSSDPEMMTDAAVAPTDAPVDSPAGPMKRVFVTSSVMNANLGGLAGGDAKCAQQASAAGLGGGKWMAWLSTNTTNAIARVTGSGPWYLTTGELAATRAQLTKPPISHRIERDETGKLVSGLVWTGTDIDGTFLDDDCADWTSTTNQNHAATRDSRVTDEPWTAVTPAGCGELPRLYCFEQ